MKMIMMIILLPAVTACNGGGGEESDADAGDPAADETADGEDTGPDPDGPDAPDAPDAPDSVDVPEDDGPEPECAAEGDARCYYVAVDGDDSNPGTLEAPFKTFHAAVTIAGPGDFIYARGGTYGFDNAMVSGVARDYDSYPATSCPEGQVLADEYCFTDTYAMIAIHDFSGWASNTPAYNVQSGEEGRPVTVRNFPGELPVLDVNDFTQRAVVGSLKAHWVIQGFEIVGGNVNLSGGTDEEQTHDFTIRGNNIHDLTLDGGDNPGLVRIDRGDIGGPYNIFIIGNEIHGIYDWEYPEQWDGVPDMQHFGAVTTLSRENYFGFDGGGTGYIRIEGNTIYHCPQAFFFKNPMAGPVEILDNVIHEVGSIGNMGAANVQMTGNLVYDVRSGWWAVGNEGYEDERLHAIAGQDAVITYNTFVGLDGLLGVRCGTGHTITNNIFFGLTGMTGGANWDTPAYIKKTETFFDALAPADSILQQITSNSNCFITPGADFQFAARYLPPEVTGTDWLVEHWNYEDASSTFGFDPDSTVIVESDPSVIFTDPAGSDYSLIDPSACPDMGVYAEDRP
jgi:hypothetical protein